MTLMMNAAASFSLICGLKRPLTKNKRKNNQCEHILGGNNSFTVQWHWKCALHAALIVFFNSRWLRFVCLPFLTPTE